MEDYELIMGSIEQYKDKACGLVDGDCNKCAARYKHNDENENWCCFDTVNFFIEWDNKYNR